MLSGELDGGGAIVQITAGAGGVDASDWAQMLLRMLIRYAERKGWKVEVLEETPAEEAGIKGATFTVTGDYAYGLLKAENGVHRLVRVSPFDAQRPPPDLVRGGHRHARHRRRHRGRHQRGRSQDRHLSRRRRRRPARQQDRLRGAHHAHADRHRRPVPERAQPALEQGQGDEDAARAASTTTSSRSARRRPPRTRRRGSRSSGARRSAATCCSRTSRSTITAPSSRRRDVDGVLDGDLDELIRTYLLKAANAKQLNRQRRGPWRLAAAGGPRARRPTRVAGHALAADEQCRQRVDAGARGASARSAATCAATSGESMSRR